MVRERWNLSDESPDLCLDRQLNTPSSGEACCRNGFHEQRW